MAESLQRPGSSPTGAGWWTRRSRTTRVALLIAVAVWLSAGGLIAWQYLVEQPPTAYQAERVLEIVRSITPLPDVVIRSQSTDEKPGEVLVTTTYANAPSQSTVLAYYTAVLTQRGWRLEAAVDRRTCFSNGPYGAAVEFPSSSPTEYIFAVSWGVACR